MIFDGHETDRRLDRAARARERFMHFGKPILSDETINRMVDDVLVETYENMVVTRAKPRVRDPEDIAPLTKRETDRLIKEIREELGYPDFRHKEWKGIRT